MDWRPVSRRHSRSRPPQLHLQTTGKYGFELPVATNNIGSANSTANLEGEFAMPPSVRANGSGDSGSGQNLFKRSLQVFSKSPLVVGYGGWTNISHPTAPPPPQHVIQIARSYSPNTHRRATPDIKKHKTRRISESLCLLVFLRSTSICSTLGGDCDCETILEANAQHEP